MRAFISESEADVCDEKGWKHPTLLKTVSTSFFVKTAENYHHAILALYGSG